MFRVFKWIVYSVSIIIIIITVYRFASTGKPAELKNYIINSQKTEQIYSELGNGFMIYNLEIRTAFGRGDAFFADNVYYLESSESLQLTLRCKTGRFPEIFGSLEETASSRPFKVYLKFSEISGDGEEAYVVFEAADEVKFGKNKDSYIYFVYCFDDVAINYAKSKLELYVFDNTSGTAQFDEDVYLTRFTLFDVNMPKTKLSMKKFTLRDP